MGEHSPAPSPGRAVYGFGLFLLFHCLFLIYVIWALVPTKILEEYLFLSYLPDKFFALYIPIVILTATTIFGFLIYPSLNLSMTPNVDDISTIRDQFSIYCCEYINSSEERCRNNITVKIDTENDWNSTRFCAEHKVVSERSKADCPDENTEKESNLNRAPIDLCDCIEGHFCLLREKPHHLEEMSKRKKIPTIRDLDLSEVCAEIFNKDDDIFIK